MTQSGDDIPELLQRRQDLLLRIADRERQQDRVAASGETLQNLREELAELETLLVRLGAQFER